MRAMEFTSMIQARLAYGGLFTGLLVGIAPIILVGYAAEWPSGVVLTVGVGSGLFGAVAMGVVFRLLFDDRFWEAVFLTTPFTFLAAVILAFIENNLSIFIGQPLVYAALAAFAGSLLGYWLDLIICQRPTHCSCERKRDTK